MPAHDLPKVQEEEAGGPIGTPPLPAMQKKLVAQVKSTTSGSEQSEDEEAEGEAETTDKMNPADVKRVRRLALIYNYFYVQFRLLLLGANKIGSKGGLSSHINL